EQKIKKEEGRNLIIEMKETADTAKACGEIKRPGQVFVGFAAETENLTGNAERKRISKRLDMICLNDVSRKDAGFDVDTNCLTLITEDGHTELPLMTKREAADRLLDKAVEIWRKKRGESEVL
ncbi:MAG: phosphopantothenoylcysteine decarboxylase, partial [Clostridia bacterium]|nr:phosphopantothenoylcysteine decarboxylase [Clostridia bacterium]